jgi:alginate O-acetyltransferase complex protein AlgI
VVFSSIEFLFFFLPAVLLAYALCPGALRNGLLLLASLLFYTWGGGELVLLLLATIAVNWALGMAADSFRRRELSHRRRACVVLSALAILSALGYFKYADFFVAQVNALGGAFLPEFVGWTLPGVALPIGISFYTFQATSYVFDVAKGRAPVLRNPITFALYVSLFPQLIAGPIVRYHELAHDLVTRRFTWEGVASGLSRFALGLCKKVIIADSVGPLADAAFGEAEPLGALAAWIGLLAYTVQIYFDFSGYSDMAVGLGRVFGFRIPENFRRPYSALSVTDFWRRWHITLSNWFRDYVYISLGGNRHGVVATYRNLGIVFLVAGLWHGANWTFVIWGVYHGSLLILERSLGLRQRAETGWLAPRRALTLLLVMLGWVIFRAESLSAAGSYLAALLRFGEMGMPDSLYYDIDGSRPWMLAVGCLVFLLPGSRSAGQWMDDSSSRWSGAMRVGVCCLAFPYATLLVISGTFSPFLYFQF